MDAFLLSALTAVAISLLLLASTVRISGRKFHFTIGRIGRFSISRQTVTLIGITTSTILIVGVVVIIVGSLHPREGVVYSISEFFLGRRFGGTVLGFLFGTLLVFWARQLVLLKPKQGISWKHRFEAVLLVGLFALGGFSDAIGTIGRRLTGVSAAGVSLTFAVLNPSSVTDFRSPESGAGTTEKTKTEDALTFLASAGNFIDRDARYVALIEDGAQEAMKAKEVDVKPTPAAIRQRDFFNETIAPMASCLIGISHFTGDDAAVNDKLARLRQSFREINSTRGKLPSDRIAEAAGKFVEVSNDLVGDLGRIYLSPASDKKTVEEIAGFCGTFVEINCSQSKPAEKLASTDEVTRRVALCAQRDKAEGQKVSADRAADLGAKITAVLADKEAFERPYMRVLYASLLWQLGDRNMAAEQLEGWLQTAKSETPQQQWDIIRVRNTLGVIFEDWIRSRDNVSVLVLEHHLDNTSKTISEMAKLAPVMAAWHAFKENGFDFEKYRFAWPQRSGICHLSGIRTIFVDQVVLALTYLKQQMVYVYRSAQHYNYFDHYSLDVTGKRDEIRTIDLSCYHQLLVSGKDNADAATQQLYAEILETYAEIELANAARISELPDADAAKTRVSNAFRAATLGLELVAKDAEAEKQEAKSSVFKATTTQKATELQFLLRRVQRRAQEGLRQL